MTYYLSLTIHLWFFMFKHIPTADKNSIHQFQCRFNGVTFFFTLQQGIFFTGNIIFFYLPFPLAWKIDISIT